MFLLADLVEINIETPKFTIQVRSFHTDMLGQISNIATGYRKTLQQILPLEISSRFTQRQVMTQ